MVLDLHEMFPFFAFYVRNGRNPLKCDAYEDPHKGYSKRRTNERLLNYTRSRDLKGKNESDQAC